MSRFVSMAISSDPMTDFVFDQPPFQNMINFMQIDIRRFKKYVLATLPDFHARQRFTQSNELPLLPLKWAGDMLFCYLPIQGQDLTSTLQPSIHQTRIYMQTVTR